MKKGLSILVLSWFFLASAVAQQKITVDEYIMTYKDVAIEKMEEYGIPASITLAQGILESGSGNSELARKANNHFGIKCHKGWNGKTYHMDDDARDECFRRYKNPDESYRDHSIFLTTRDRYADLFNLKTTDYKGWARGLKKAGYATNPRYPHLLIKIIEENHLYEFDKGVTPVHLARSEQNSIPNHSVSANSLPPPSSSDFELVEIWETGRKVYVNNGAKFIFAGSGDSFSEIAADFEIYSWQLPKYNELDKKHTLKEGEMIYIEKKNKKNKEAGTHTARPGESMHSIAQLYGIRLGSFYKHNKMEEGTEAKTGQVLKLH
ncbi:MAG: glucosaminidase domain-containing protein [Bacteroidales bacterium]|jgi:LysM repeat protein|nr:glucosaminidase domain-containing protein [Bacteroidales bacterium]